LTAIVEQKNQSVNCARHAVATRVIGWRSDSIGEG
jgi:hypothetical protein